MIDYYGWVWASLLWLLIYWPITVLEPDQVDSFFFYLSLFSWVVREIDLLVVTEPMMDHDPECLWLITHV